MRLISTLTFAMAAFYTAGAQTMPQADTKRMDSLFASIDLHHKSMGSGALSKGGKILYSRAIGYAGAPGRKADTETQYRIGSISKVFTSVMVWQLVEEKKLKLQQPLADFYPQMPNAGQITIGHMLNHHSGLHNFTDDEVYMTYYLTPQTQADMLDRISKLKPDFAPGERGEYSNTNYVLLGYILEKVTGKTYAQNLQQRIIDKLGLKHTSVGTRIDGSRNQAYSYTRGMDSLWQIMPETDMSIPAAAGCIISTPSDLCRFISGLFTHRLISEASLEQMTEIKDDYGYGIFKVPFYEKSGYGHTGGIDGFSSTLGYFPGDSVAACYISNGVVLPANDVIVGMLSIYYHKDYRIPLFKKGIPINNLERFEGVYASAALPLKITVKKENNTLTAQATGQSAFILTAEDETTFAFDPAGITIIFKPGTDGKINTFTLKQGGGSYLFTKE